MASRRRKPFASRSRMANGRQGLWLRQPAFSPTLQLASLGIFSDLVADPSDWERDDQIGVQTKKGRGQTRLERQFGEWDFALRFTNTTNPVIPSFEVMVWEQSSQFATIVTDNATFDTTLENNRILWYSTYPVNAAYRPGAADSTGYLYGHARWDVKSKARLSDRAIGLAVRLGFDTAAAGTATVPLANWVGYVTTP